MTIQISSGAADAMYSGPGLKDALGAFVVRIYSGQVPETADAEAPSSELMCTVSVGGDGTGMSFGESTAGVMAKNAGEVWVGNVDVGGVPSYYRLSPLTDDGSVSSTIARIQGSCGPTGDLLTQGILTQGAPQSIDVYTLRLPRTGR